MKTPIFDLDWTLIKGGNKAHLESFTYSIEKIFNIKTSLEKIDIQGKIDSQILLELLVCKNISFFEAKKKSSFINKRDGKIFFRKCKI